MLVKTASILQSLGLRYLVSGGFAVSVWGRPRATFDIDIVIIIAETEVSLLTKALKKISQAGYLDEENARESARKGRGSFNFIDSNTGLKVDFFIGGRDPFTISKFKRRKFKTIGGQKIPFIAPEDLILSKLQWYKENLSTLQLDDIKSILKISGSKLDHHYLKEWAARLKVEDILDNLYDS